LLMFVFAASIRCWCVRPVVVVLDACCFSGIKLLSVGLPGIVSAR
jgi:hypothetical protein